MKDSPLWGPSLTDQPTTYVEDQAAKALLADADLAVVGAHAAGNSFWVLGRFRGEAEGLSALGVNLVGYLEGFLWIFSNAL